jgi:hypothetical protein
MRNNKKARCETNPFKYEKAKFDERKYIRWVNPFDSVNQGRLGHSQSWKYKKQKKYEYYG